MISQTPQTSCDSVVMKDLTKATDFESQKQFDFTDHNDRLPKTPVSFEITGGSETLHKDNGKKRKCAISCLVDDIFSDIDGSFFMRKDRSKIQRTMSRSKSYRSLSLDKEVGKSSQIKSAILCDDTISTNMSQTLVESNRYKNEIIEGSHESAINIYEKLFIPDIPATVSSLSCNGSSSINNTINRLNRNARQVSLSDNSSLSSRSAIKDDYEASGNSPLYGWFVETDDGARDECRSSCASDAVTISYSAADDLAFKAPTAPKRVDDDAELAWACAADTVDDVLGDLF